MSDENDRLKSVLAMGIVAAPVGAIVIFIGLVIGTGDINNALTLIIFSIICTLGISLFIWIPLCWVTGLLVLGIITGLLKLLGFGLNHTFPGLNRPVSEVLQPAIANRGTVKQQSLANYIRKAKAKGFSDSQINNRLRQEGWTVGEIEQAQGLVEHFS